MVCMRDLDEAYSAEPLKGIENDKKKHLYRSHYHCVNNHCLFILFSDYSAQGIVDDDLSYDVELYYDGGKLFGSKINKV